MARKKHEPCEFCAKECFHTDEQSGIAFMMEIYPEHNMIAFSVTGVAENGNFVELEQTFPMNYCPVCGRKCGY